jgi:ElaB/YqjD/DUF883 family membrane-anchored ribosome-binding protein
MNISANPTREAKAPVSADQLAHDLKVVARDAENLIRAKAGNLNQKTRNRLANAWDKTRVTCNRVGEKAALGAQATDRCIRSHPYETFGVALGLGVVVGLLLMRKSN